MPGPLDELQRLLGGQGGLRPGSAPTVPGGGLLDLTPEEWAAFMRRAPLAGDVPWSTSEAPASAPPLFSDPRFSIEMQGGGALGGNAYRRPPLGRQLLGSILGGGFPVPAPQGIPSSEGWQPGIGLRFRQPF
jgi:hypothetical protein